MAAIPHSVIEQTGARLSLASFLVGIDDVTNLPPWRSRAVAGAYRATGFTPPEPGASPGEMYARFLVFLDQVLGNVGNVPLRDRLDAQGLVWMIVKHEPRTSRRGKPNGWTAEEIEQLKKFRSGKPVGPPPRTIENGGKQDLG